MIQFTGRPLPARLLYPEAFFRIKGIGKSLFLTFDDGPDPGSTPVILDILKKKNITATFFCTGEKVLDNTGLFAQIAAAGHIIGNHGFSHLNGMKTAVKEYCSDVMKGRDITCSNIFRPPYGRLRIRQYKIIERTMRIVFWDLMPYDFDRDLQPEACMNILTRKLRSGSIIVLHDTSESHAPAFLEQFIQKALDNGYTFFPLTDNLLRK